MSDIEKFLRILKDALNDCAEAERKYISIKPGAASVLYNSGRKHKIIRIPKLYNSGKMPGLAENVLRKRSDK